MAPVQPPVDHKGRPITNKAHTLAVDSVPGTGDRWARIVCRTCDYRHQMHQSEAAAYVPPLSCRIPPSGFRDPAVKLSEASKPTRRVDPRTPDVDFKARYEARKIEKAEQARERVIREGNGE